MRKWQIIILSMLFALPLIGRAEGVDFFNGTVYQALDVAREQNKLVVVEFYAPWSHKSRWMHDNVLTKSDIGQWFLVVSVDTQSDDGAALAVHYNVTDYPVILVCNAGGVVLDKIDRTLEVADFQARLSTIRLSTDRGNVKQLQQIFTLCESADSTTKMKVNELTGKYIASNDVSVLTSASLFDLFTTSAITYYGSESYKFLVNNANNFFDKSQAVDRIKMVLTDAVMPYVIGSLPFDEEAVFKVESDSTSIAYFPPILDLCKLARLRADGQAVKYILLLSDIVQNFDEQIEYQLVMSLDFAAVKLDRTDRSIRQVARHLLENLMQKSPSPTKTSLIESLLAKFL